VVYDCFFSQGQIVSAYTATEPNVRDPFSLRYLGSETDETVKTELKKYDYFVCITDNVLRKQTTEVLVPLLGQPVIALHKTAVLSRNIQSGEGVMIGPRVIVNSGAVIGNGVILQSGCIVEHQSSIGDYVHIGTGTVLGAGVKIGASSFVGAGAVIGEGIQIGEHCFVGNGVVVLKDLRDGEKIL